MSSKDLNLVVTLGGRPVPDQALGIRAFKDACLAASKTPPAQAGEWTLTAPDGRTWKADSPLKCCGLEQRERVPASVALARIVEEMERYDAEEAAKAASAQETSPAPLRMCISYQPHAKCIWHLDCTVGNDSGIMSVIAHEESRSLLECGHCKQRGYYPKGSVGSVCVDVVSAENRRA